MLRFVVGLLLIANALYFVWSQGHLAPLGLAPVDPSEPERLQAQIRPESLRLLNAPKDAAASPAKANPRAQAEQASPLSSVAGAVGTATVAPSPVGPPANSATSSAPPPDPTACWVAAGFTPAQAQALRSALVNTQLPRPVWQLNETPIAGRWVVYMGRYTAEQIDRKRGELRALGVEFRTLPPPLGPALALGTYYSEEAAQQGLRDLNRKGVRTARVVQERAESSAWSLRLPAVTEAQRTTVAGLGAAMAGKRLQACE